MPSSFLLLARPFSGGHPVSRGYPQGLKGGSNSPLGYPRAEVTLPINPLKKNLPVTGGAGGGGGGGGEGRWTHIAVTVDGDDKSRISFYVDAKMVFSEVLQGARRCSHPNWNTVCGTTNIIF
jgi:hypothetical protein